MPIEQQRWNSLDKSMTDSDNLTVECMACGDVFQTTIGQLRQFADGADIMCSECQTPIAPFSDQLDKILRNKATYPLFDRLKLYPLS